jgi:hypothetical protein
VERVGRWQIVSGGNTRLDEERRVVDEAGRSGQARFVHDHEFAPARHEPGFRTRTGQRGFLQRFDMVDAPQGRWSLRHLSTMRGHT